MRDETLGLLIAVILALLLPWWVAILLPLLPAFLIWIICGMCFRK